MALERVRGRRTQDTNQRHLLVDARLRPMRFPEISPGMLATMDGDRDFYRQLVTKGIITSVSLASATPFIPRSFEINSEKYVLVENNPGGIGPSHIVPTFDYIPKNGDTSINPRISFLAIKNGVGNVVTLKREYTCPDGSTIGINRSFSRLGVPLDEVMTLDMPSHDIDLGEGIKPDIISVIRDTSFVKTQGRNIKNSPTRYFIEAVEGDHTYTFNYVRPYPSVPSKRAFIVDQHAQTRRETPIHETRTPEAILSWFINAIDGESMVNISHQYTESQRLFRRTLDKYDKASNFSFSEREYANVLHLIEYAGRSKVKPSEYEKFTSMDSIQMSILAKDSSLLSSYGIGEVEFYFYPSDGKLKINFYSLGQSGMMADAIKISRDKNLQCLSYFSAQQVAQIIEELAALTHNTEVDKNVSITMSSARDRKKEKEVRVLVDMFSEGVPLAERQIGQLAQEARSINPYEEPYQGSLVDLPGNLYAILLKGTSSEPAPISSDIYTAVYQRHDILAPKLQQKVREDSNNLVEVNEKKQPIRLIEPSGRFLNDPSQKQKLVEFLLTRGIKIPFEAFSQNDLILSITESTYQELLKTGINGLDISKPLSHEITNIIKGLIYLRMEIPYINQIYRQPEDWSENIQSRDRDKFPKLNERYLRAYTELLIRELKKGVTNLDTASGSASYEMWQMQVSAEKAQKKLKSMSGQIIDKEIGDSSTYGSLLLSLFVRSLENEREQVQEINQIKARIMSAIEQ